MRQGGPRPDQPFSRLLLMLAGLWLACAAPAQAASAFADWSAVVVAGDWHAGNGGPTEGFDNARRDVSAALQRAGFQPQNLRQYSVRPERYTPRPGKTDVDPIYEGLVDLSARTRSGCLVYFTSHGSPYGLTLNEGGLAPAVLAGMLETTCGQRPTVVVISACYSGVFVPALAGANRMILTAARPDRTSFGCGQDDRYPYFDDCFLQSMNGAREFLGLAQATLACVAAREAAEGAQPPSEPQLWIGAGLRPMLPLYGFETPPPPKL